MIIDIALITVFFASIAFVWYRVSLKIPELVAVPDEVIAQRLHEDSAKVRLFILHFKTFYKERRYIDVVWSFLLKLFYKFHLVLLRADNFITGVLRIIHEKKQKRSKEMQSYIRKTNSDEYWKDLKDQDFKRISGTGVKLTEVRIKK